MSTKTKFVLLIAIFLIVGVSAIAFLFVADVAVLNPKGMIGEKQRDLLFIATLLMLIVVIPVFFLTFAIGWKYRAENQDAEHEPNWDHSILAEFIWWAVPCGIILVLGLITWRGCHELDPFKPIPAENEMRIQVVALRWKWLFIYPDHHIATVNYFRFPKDTAVRFEITADAPMNSFWIPQLGGQIYAMPGMRSELNLIAHETGQFRGSSANISGKGFASMVFTAEAATNENFEEWVQIVRGSPKMLSDAEYDRLAEPSEYNPASFYVLDTDGLFDRIAMKYMVPMP